MTRGLRFDIFFTMVPDFRESPRSPGCQDGSYCFISLIVQWIIRVDHWFTEHQLAEIAIALEKKAGSQDAHIFYYCFCLLSTHQHLVQPFLLAFVTYPWPQVVDVSTDNS